MLLNIRVIFIKHLKQCLAQTRHLLKDSCYYVRLTLRYSWILRLPYLDWIPLLLQLGLQWKIQKLMVHLFIARFSSQIPTCFSMLVNVNMSILIPCALKLKGELVLITENLWFPLVPTLGSRRIFYLYLCSIQLKIFLFLCKRKSKNSIYLRPREGIGGIVCSSPTVSFTLIMTIVPGDRNRRGGREETTSINTFSFFPSNTVIWLQTHSNKFMWPKY